MDKNPEKLVGETELPSLYKSGSDKWKTLKPEFLEFDICKRVDPPALKFDDIASKGMATTFSSDKMYEEVRKLNSERLRIQEIDPLIHLDFDIELKETPHLIFKPSFEPSDVVERFQFFFISEFVKNIFLKTVNPRDVSFIPAKVSRLDGVPVEKDYFLLFVRKVLDPFDYNKTKWSRYLDIVEKSKITWAYPVEKHFDLSKIANDQIFVIPRLFREIFVSNKLLKYLIYKRPSGLWLRDYCPRILQDNDPSFIGRRQRVFVEDKPDPMEIYTINEKA